MAWSGLEWPGVAWSGLERNSIKPIYFSLCKFCKFLMSFLKAQVSFPLKFASIFNAIKHSFSVLSLADTYTLVKGAS